MSETGTEEIFQQIDLRIAALTSAERHLKRPSTISFAERRDLSTKAARAVEALRAARTELESRPQESAEDEAADATTAGAETPEQDAASQDAAGQDAVGQDAAPAETSGETAEPQLPESVQAALDQADRVLALVGGAQPAGINRQAASAARKMPGQNRRGGGGMNSQQRPPDRIGE